MIYLATALKMKLNTSVYGRMANFWQYIGKISNFKIFSWELKLKYIKFPFRCQKPIGEFTGSFLFNGGFNSLGISFLQISLNIIGLVVTRPLISHLSMYNRLKPTCDKKIGIMELVYIFNQLAFNCTARGSIARCTAKAGFVRLLKCKNTVWPEPRPNTYNVQLFGAKHEIGNLMGGSSFLVFLYFKTCLIFISERIIAQYT